MEPATQQSSRPTIEIEQHVRQLSDEWVKAIVRADAAALDHIMADDFYFTYPLEGDDKAQFISDVTAGDLKIKHIAREQVAAVDLRRQVEAGPGDPVVYQESSSASCGGMKSVASLKAQVSSLRRGGRAARRSFKPV